LQGGGAAVRQHNIADAGSIVLPRLSREQTTSLGFTARTHVEWCRALLPSGRGE
jgi:hypothetical protein